MTANQISYWKVQEDKRHNTTAENIELAKHYENVRHNTELESETRRHNWADEGETQRHNRVGEEEIQRAHKAAETENFRSHRVAEIENERSHKATESENARSNNLSTAAKLYDSDVKLTTGRMNALSKADAFGVNYGSLLAATLGSAPDYSKIYSAVDEASHTFTDNKVNEFVTLQTLKNRPSAGKQKAKSRVPDSIKMTPAQEEIARKQIKQQQSYNNLRKIFH